MHYRSLESHELMVWALGGVLNGDREGRDR